MSNQDDDAFLAIGKWCALVIAIALGVCGGLYLFGWFLTHQMEKKMDMFIQQLPAYTRTAA